MGRSYYFLRVSVTAGMTVVGAVTVPVVLPAKFSPDGLIQYAYRVIDCPGATVAEKPYDPLFVL
jgi:p-aminobenzoyl-glutamate transporter AbgT